MSLRAQAGNVDTEAGWHRDPVERHRLRFWDGDSWTDLVRDEQESHDPLPAHALLPPPLGIESSHRRNAALRTIAAVVAVVGIVLVFVGLLGLLSHLTSIGHCDCAPSPPGLSTIPALIVGISGAVLAVTAIVYGRRVSE
jgi:hypothetical protein